jgi:hypothetical protein
MGMQVVNTRAIVKALGGNYTSFQSSQPWKGDKETKFDNW